MLPTYSHKTTIGRAELVHFMDYEIADMPAKVDTGAYRSSVHASDIQLSADGKELSFTIFGGLPLFKSLATKITTNEFRVVSVTNSFGHKEERYEITLKVKIASEVINTGFTLATRDNMMYPILLGRKLLNKRFIVDTALTGVDRLELKRRYNIQLPEEEEQQYENSNSI